MLAVRFKFLAGGYHATPWGSHVNEGLVEWPPSPWRILRSLVAVYHRKASDLSEDGVRRVVGRLAALPVYHLPAAPLGHTRHFMPQRDPLGTDRTKVFDTFASPRDPLVVIWPNVEFDGEETKTFQRLLSGLGYLGRAESWVEAELVSDWAGEFNCWPLTGEMSEKHEVVSLLTAREEGEYQAWSREVAAVADSEVKKRRGRSSGGTMVPPDLWVALHVDTGDLQRQGWSMPPGSRWVDYLRPLDAFREEYQRQTIRVRERMPEVARFVLTGAVLPRLTDALAIGERMRVAVMSQTKGVEGTENALRLFAGRDEGGDPLQTSNSHAFYLPTDDDGDGKIDHATVYLPTGLDEPAQQVLGRLRKLWGAEGHDIFMALAGMGEAKDFGGFNPLRGETTQLGTSRVWESRTPYLLSRHPKVYRDGRPKMGSDGEQVDGPKAQLLLDLERRGLPRPIWVEMVPAVRVAGKDLRWLEFRRERRRGGGRLASLSGYGFRLVFDRPVTGPLAIGYGCHFGLGQFGAFHESVE